MSFNKKYELLSQSLDDSFVLKERFTKNNNQIEFEDDDDDVNDDQTSNDSNLLTSSIINNRRSLRTKKKRTIFHSKLINIFYILILIAFLSIIIIVFGFQKPLAKSFNKISKYVKNKISNQNELNEWSFELKSFGTESCIRLYDIDEDGLDDLIFGLVGVEGVNNFGDNLGKNEGTLIAVKGTNGTILWKFETKSEIFEINCLIDIDLDGRLDCIGTGRKHTFIAFDPHNGKIYWDASYKINVNESWNIYNPVVIPYDLDKDGVNEIIISTGGNPLIPSDVHEREAGKIMLFSGKNGSKMGQDLILPNRKETYMSPVLHTQIDNSQYLFFGTGGETIPGNLYIISLPDFVNYVLNTTSFTNKFQGSYESNKILEKKFKSNDKIKGFYSLYETSSKGVMVPPVLADVNQSGSKDILMLSFNGAVVMFNGDNFEIIWEKKFECFETYTSPSPGYFDDDDVLDFMLVQNLGTFDFYLNSSTLILSGSDGSILWQMNSSRMQMVSPLTIQTTQNYSIYRDIFFFRAQGIEYNPNTIHQVYHGIEPQQPIDKSPNKPNGKRESSEDEFKKCQSIIQNNMNGGSESIDAKCEQDDLNDAYLSTFGFLIDRTIQDSPITVFKSAPTKVLYNLTNEDLDGNSKLLNRTVCVIMEPMERNTGAIGHLSSKDDLDIVTIITKGGNVRNPLTNNYVKILTDLKVFKKSVKFSLERKDRLNKKLFNDLIVHSSLNEQQKEIDISELKFRNIQSWNAYMGTRSDSSFV